MREIKQEQKPATKTNYVRYAFYSSSPFIQVFSKLTPLKIYKKKLYEDGIFNYQKLSVSIWKELSNLYQNFNTVEICKYAKVLWGVKTNGVFSRGWGYKTSRGRSVAYVNKLGTLLSASHISLLVFKVIVLLMLILFCVWCLTSKLWLLPSFDEFLS